MKLRATTQAGFTLVEIMIVVAIIGLIAAIAIPSYVHARETSQQNVCIRNLRQIDGATQTWALEHNKMPDNTYTFDNIADYLWNSKIPKCPAGGDYAPGGTVGDPPTCTILGHELDR